MINIIAAISSNNVLGMNNSMIWHLTNDLKRFKKLTIGKTVVMGRKTFESLGKPLPDRRNIVITSKYIKGVETVKNIKEALSLSNNDCFIIGGGQIYKETINIADKIYLTLIEKEFKGDTFFPYIDNDKWEIVFEEKHYDEINSFNYKFINYEKK
jgi:dihydrofolate reductase